MVARAPHISLSPIRAVQILIFQANVWTSVVVASAGGGEATVDKDSDGSRTADKSEKVEERDHK